MFALGLRFKDRPEDPWTKRFNAFKAGDHGAVKAGAATLAYALKNANWKPRRRVILGAISSKDIELSSKSPVDALCRHLSVALDWEWRQDIIKKKPHKSLHTITASCHDRDAEVKDAYTVSALGDEPGMVMIIDEFVTRGATSGEIKRAFSKENPGWCFACIALAKTEGVGYWRDKGIVISNSHIPDSLLKVWEQNE
ncbi:MAG: hypothetical protein SGJ20_07020 [Planctomycetota bacterium]|nr:hypothetical protein [Planctomycetota bacterium]